MAAASVGTTWYTVSPACLRTLVYFVGEPADVVTNLTPWSITNSAMLGSRTNAWAMFTPNGLSVRSRIRRISSLTASSSPEDVSMIPQAPARDTAEASWLRAIQPIGACTIGISTPEVTRDPVVEGQRKAHEDHHAVHARSGTDPAGRTLSDRVDRWYADPGARQSLSSCAQWVRDAPGEADRWYA